MFNSPLNRLVFLALAQESADAITYGLGQLPTIPQRGQWVNVLRHHDELNLSRLTRDQREQVFAAFGPEPEMQVYSRGLRRRPAPKLGGDPKWLRLAYSVLFRLPGAPMVFYGEEIGMDEQMALAGRMSVRAPMQWMSHGNGGFSTATPDQLVRPVVGDGDYRFEQVSVGRIRADRDSLLNWMAELIRTRRECPEIGTGAWQAMKTGNDAVLAMRHDGDSSATVILNNLSRKRVTVALDLTPEEIAATTDLFCDRVYEPLEPTNPRFRIEGFGYRWMRVGGIY